MKNKITGAVLAVFLAAGAQAGGDMKNKSPEEKQQHINDKLNKMDQRLNLTPDQETAIRQILQRKVDGQVQEKQAHEEIRSELTPEQQSEYDRMKAEKKDQKKEQ